VVAQVKTVGMMRSRRGMTLLQMGVSDGVATLLCTWFNAEYLRGRFVAGQTLALYGRVEREGGRVAMRQPEFEILDSGDEALDSLKLGRIVPIYEAIGKITSGRIRLYVSRALEGLSGELPDGLPATIRQRLGLVDRRFAFEQVHFPVDVPMPLLQAARSAGHFRLIFEELFYLQTGLEVKRRRVLNEQGFLVEVNGAIRERLKKVLPFHPTVDQKRVLREIVDDMRSGHPMRRLLQGDVGSGKTIVALEAAVIAMENGYQVVLMAPTQILATQHYLSARERLTGYYVHLITGSAKAGQRRMQQYSLATDQPQLAIGTQALLEGSFQFARLGLVIVDEQHRFGVLQRFRLMQKGERSAHLLVMTATPIPRTLALSLYGDLDVSLIRQLPPGRLPVVTRIVPEKRDQEVYEFVRKQVAQGRQAYFVYPVIEESETADLKPALRMEQVLRQVFSEFRVGLLHGRLSDDEKNAVMRVFRGNDIQILVSTTVIEVGMDVPNATVMVIAHAERFGIAQLHQLRGRVGRPRKHAVGKSYCLLMCSDDASELARKRLEAVAASSDGFALADLDLKLRGPGEFFGTRQSGLPTLQVADPLRDEEFIELARSEARGFFETASVEEQRALLTYIRQRWQRRYGLVEVG
jgi:ATP-dependent DNA helicase RecG